MTKQKKSINPLLKEINSNKADIDFCSRKYLRRLFTHLHLKLNKSKTHEIDFKCFEIEENR